MVGVLLLSAGSGKPQLLRVMAFNQLCELLSDRLEAGRPDDAPEIETPMVLQAFIQPWQDLRYVTTYINTGTAVTCHTFQRKYSRRYTPMSAATAAQVRASSLARKRHTHTHTRTHTHTHTHTHAHTHTRAHAQDPVRCLV